MTAPAGNSTHLRSGTDANDACHVAATVSVATSSACCRSSASSHTTTTSMAQRELTATATATLPSHSRPAMQPSRSNVVTSNTAYSRACISAISVAGSESWPHRAHSYRRAEIGKGVAGSAQARNSAGHSSSFARGRRAGTTTPPASAPPVPWKHSLSPTSTATSCPTDSGSHCGYLRARSTSATSASVIVGTASLTEA